MPESVHSATSRIPTIPEPVVLAWTADYDDGDVAYIAGCPPPPRPPPPSVASTSDMPPITANGHPLSPPRPPPPSLASESNDPLANSRYRVSVSAVSLARATVGDGSSSRRISLIEEERVLDVVDEERPPDYAEASMVPTYPLDYTFLPVDGDPQSLVITPCENSIATSPLYHIKVTHDVFDPSFFVTSIRRGGIDGQIVGDFTTKADCSALEETVYFKKLEYHIFKRLVAGTKKNEFQWKLQHRNGGLLLWKWEKHWTCRRVAEQIVVKNKQYDILAQFYPPALRTPSHPRKIARMTMQPAGQKFFDEILISLLILERKRRKLVSMRS